MNFHEFSAIFRLYDAILPVYIHEQSAVHAFYTVFEASPIVTMLKIDTETSP